MALEFKLPDIGEGIAEGEIVKWLVDAGQAVEEHQPVVEVMTDKATVEIPAPRAGTIGEICAAEGDVVPVGQTIFVFGDGTQAPTASVPAAAVEAPPASPAASGSVVEFRLPDIGEGIAEGEIVRWLVDEGAAVAEHQPVVEVMTDKATVEVPAPADGTIVRIAVASGDVVPIGTVLYDLALAGGPVAPGATQATVPAAPSASTAVSSAAPAVPAAASKRAPGAPVLAVPSARRVARELKVNLAEVPGSGHNGVIRRADVEAHHRAGARAPVVQPSAPATTQVALETRVPFRGIRRKISEALSRSMYTAVHFTVVEELDVTELVRVRAKAKHLGAEEGVKMTYMPFIMKAVASGLARHPELNSQLDEATEEIVTYANINLGIATDTPNGLLVPVIRDVQNKGLLELGRELQELAERTRGGKVTPAELKGGTFTITNAGNIGGTLATPVINFPEVGILGVHRIVKRPGVVETPEGDKVEVRQYMNLSISVDHRLVDGASAVRFLVHMRNLLENPGLLAL